MVENAKETITETPEKAYYSKDGKAMTALSSERNYTQVKPMWLKLLHLVVQTLLSYSKILFFYQSESNQSMFASHKF